MGQLGAVAVVLTVMVSLHLFLAQEVLRSDIDKRHKVAIITTAVKGMYALVALLLVLVAVLLVASAVGSNGHTCP